MHLADASTDYPDTPAEMRTAATLLRRAEELKREDLREDLLEDLLKVPVYTLKSTQDVERMHP